MYLPNKSICCYVIFLFVMAIAMLKLCILSVDISDCITNAHHNCTNLKLCFSHRQDSDIVLNYLASFVYMATFIGTIAILFGIWLTNRMRRQAVPMQSPLFLQDEQL